MNEIKWGEDYLVGGSVPGAPLVGIGRGRKTSFGQTTPRADNSDLWQETLNEDETKYFVDGNWRDLKISREVIKVKKGKDVDLVIRKTHRGPILDHKTIMGGSQLFGAQI